MNLRRVLGLYLLLLLVQTCRSYEVIREVYTGDHFADLSLATNGSGIVDHSTIIIMYDDSCQFHLQRLEVTFEAISTKYPHLLHTKYLYVVWHNWKAYSSVIWYEQPDSDVLHKKYPISECPTALFFKKGQPSDRPTSTWSESSLQNFRDWAWKSLLFQIDVVNQYTSAVSVTIEDPNKRSHAPFTFELDIGQRTMLETFPGHNAIVRDKNTNDLVNFYILDDCTQQLTIQAGPPNMQAMMTEMKNKEVNDQLLYQSIMTNHGDRYLLNLQQPLFVPSYTKMGFKKIEMPIEAYKILRNFYDKNVASKQTENWHPNNPSINQNEVQCHMVYVTDEIRVRVGEIIRPVLEEWCDCKLQLTYAFGIREYHKGNVLLNHVDRLQTHVISAILQVYQDLGGAGDWPLEVYGWDGVKRHVKLYSGQMVLYESAKLIHGKAYPFPGVTFANIFYHFQPTTLGEWPYTRPDTALRTLYGKAGTSLELHPLEQPEQFWNQARTQHIWKHDEL